MPADFTKVPHYPQSSPGACLPACLRMVLAGMGQQYNEAQLADILESYEFGTPASRVVRLARLGYQVIYESFSWEQLVTILQQGHFPIPFVRADFLPWADFTGFHAVVVVKIEGETVFLHDPAQTNGLLPLEIDGFLMAWEEFDTKVAIIAPGR
ncbi:MAG: C39 family peptidase [Anaerolineae bacterium]|nr:C39 family peptidase [Anaerolineae bacterium]